MKLVRTIALFLMACLALVSFAHADLVEKTTIRYKQTKDHAVMFEVSNEHAKKVIEPQMNFHSSLDEYQNKAVMIQLTDYVVDHTQYALFEYYGLQSNDFKLGKIYVGNPSTLDEGMIFIADVVVKKGWKKKKLKVGFVIPSVKGFDMEDIVYFTYPS